MHNLARKITPDLQFFFKCSCDNCKQRVKISKNNIGNTDRYHLLQPMCITKEIVTFKVDCDHQASGELVSHNAYPDI